MRIVTLPHGIASRPERYEVEWRCGDAVHRREARARGNTDLVEAIAAGVRAWCPEPADDYTVLAARQQ